MTEQVTLASGEQMFKKQKTPHPVRNPEGVTELLMSIVLVLQPTDAVIGDSEGSLLIDCIPLLAPFYHAFWLHS